MLHLLQMGPSKVLTTFPLQIQNSSQLSLLELPPCCVSTRNTVTLSSDSSGMYTSTVQSSPASANAALSPHPRLQTSYPLSAVSSPSAPSPPSLAPGYPSMPPASSLPPDSLRVVQWNAGGLRARSTELLHFLSSHPVDLIYIQESNLNSSSSFRFPGFSALHSDRTHSRSGIFSPDAMYASSGVIIFVRQGLSFSELSTSSLSLLDPYSDYVGVNISLSNSSSLSFLNVYAVTNITKLERLQAARHTITGCLSSSSIPLLLSEASLPPLRVTLTHFTLSCNEWALRLQTSFPISGLARLGVKTRLCRSSWRAFASTHPLIPPSTSPREAFLACPPFPSWNLPSFTEQSTLSSPCSHSRSDLPLSHQGAALAHLNSFLPHDLVL